MTGNFSDRFSLYWTHYWEVPFYLASRSWLKILPLIICYKISIDFFERKKEGNFPWQDFNCWPQRPKYGDPPDLSLVHFCCIGAEVWGIPVWGPVGSTFNLLTFWLFWPWFESRNPRESREWWIKTQFIRQRSARERIWINQRMFIQRIRWEWLERIYKRFQRRNSTKEAAHRQRRRRRRNLSVPDVLPDEPAQDRFRLQRLLRSLRRRHGGQQHPGQQRTLAASPGFRTRSAKIHQRSGCHVKIFGYKVFVTGFFEAFIRVKLKPDSKTFLFRSKL